jgi:cytochrome b-561 domain containing protein 2
MAQAILAISGTSILTSNSSHNKRVTAHWVLQTLAIVLITIAQVSIYMNKERNGYLHYQTIHSYFGCFTYLSTIAGIFGGSAAKYSTSLASIATPVKFKISHGTLGAVLYVVVILTICLGINQTWASEVDSRLRLITMGTLVVSCFFVVTKSIQTALARVASLPKKK